MCEHRRKGPPGAGRSGRVWGEGREALRRGFPKGAGPAHASREAWARAPGFFQRNRGLQRLPRRGAAHSELPGQVECIRAGKPLDPAQLGLIRATQKTHASEPGDRRNDPALSALSPSVRATAISAKCQTSFSNLYCPAANNTEPC